MPSKITYKHPDFPDDTEFELYGFGLVTNGVTKTLTDEEEQAGVNLVGMPTKEYFGASEDVKVEGSSNIKPQEVVVVEEAPAPTEIIEAPTEGGEG